MSKSLKKKDLKPIERNTPSSRKAKRFGWLIRLPIIKQIYRKKHFHRGFDVESVNIFP